MKAHEDNELVGVGYPVGMEFQSIDTFKVYTVFHKTSTENGVLFTLKSRDGEERTLLREDIEDNFTGGEGYEN
jgi:hypothetical protein